MTKITEYDEMTKVPEWNDKDQKMEWQTSANGITDIHK
jgi:hypothetical protein